MSLQNQNQNLLPPQKPRRTKLSRDSVDFCKIGGLGNQLKTLREVIIFPLLHGNVFSHFNIKAPRGVLFYGPPGTGKTLVAAALANELNKEGIGKVAFFSRKGADVLDKWVGGSEKNLRDLFEKATKSKPSIIFFDELDGLAPIREKQTDQIHSSVVATLLVLMDGLDTKPGVIVIGATNRIEAVDPALRRPGRFDKELYFPLPGVEARRQILEVHTASWKHKPNSTLLSDLVEATPGFSGADLQAICSEAILASMKRLYPCLKGIKIDPEKVKVEECDFLSARLYHVPTTLKNGYKLRRLTTIIQPLLESQLQNITRQIHTFWPHFLVEDYKYIIGEDRYAGRIILIGNAMQGVDSHLIPAVLQHLEYLPLFIYDVTKMFKKNALVQLQFPSVVLLSKVDEWWPIIDECEQLSIVSSLEEIHAGLPILVMATCRQDVPDMLRNFFYNNSSILLKIEDPTYEERKDFLKPLFFDRSIVSLRSGLDNNCRIENSKINLIEKRGRKSRKSLLPTKATKRRIESPGSSSLFPVRKRRKTQETKVKNNLIRSNSVSSMYDIHKQITNARKNETEVKRCDSVISFCPHGNAPNFSTVLSKVFSQRLAKNCPATGNIQLKTVLFEKKIKSEESDTVDHDGNPVNNQNGTHNRELAQKIKLSKNT